MSIPVYILAASPDSPADVPGFFREDGPAFALLRQMPEFRPNGFDLNTLNRPTIEKGKYWETKDRRVTVRLYEDGASAATIPADHTFLGWGREADEFRTSPRLNPVALIEATSCFVALVARFVAEFKSRPRTIRFRCEFSGYEDRAVRPYLNPYGVKQTSWMFDDPRYALQTETTEWSIDGGSLTDAPLKAAARLVERVYLMFGVPTDKVPYLDTTDGESTVNPRLFSE